LTGEDSLFADFYKPHNVHNAIQFVFKLFSECKLIRLQEAVDSIYQ